ncbi:MAG: hypothetical protein ACR2NN_05905 [Bryobacteraceae bacterium]
MRTRNWNIRCNAPKPELESDLLLEAEMDAISGGEENSIASAVPDSDPNRPLTDQTLR